MHYIYIMFDSNLDQYGRSKKIDFFFQMFVTNNIFFFTYQRCGYVIYLFVNLYTPVNEVGGPLVSWCPLKAFFQPPVRMMTSKKPLMPKIYCLLSMFQLLRSRVFFTYWTCFMTLNTLT